MSKPEIVALLPMRHSSERVPGKNYRQFADKPLFRHILDKLLDCSLIREVVINTDSPVIAEMVAPLARVRILERPECLLGGETPMNDVLAYDMSQVEADYYLQTHSTNPLLKIETISSLIETFLAQKNEFDSLFTVTLRQQRFWSVDGKPINHDPKVLLRTQDLEGFYEENSCAYIFSKASFEQASGRIGQKPLLFPMSSIESQDIDIEDEFVIAEAVYKALYM